MKPIIDTTQYRDSIRKAFKKDKPAAGGVEHPEGHGMELVHAGDDELMGEESYPPGTLKDWLGWRYQKRANGKWDKICPAPKKILKKK